MASYKPWWGTHHVGLDGAVGGGVGDAGEDEAVAHLVVIEEGLVGLVDGTGLLGRSEIAGWVGEVSVGRGTFAAKVLLS